MQFRAFGLRVKRPNYAPSLVASTLTQLPIIGWEQRFMTENEAAKLQGLDEIDLSQGKTASFRALGNAVNANLVSFIAQGFTEEKQTQAIQDASNCLTQQKSSYNTML